MKKNIFVLLMISIIVSSCNVEKTLTLGPLEMTGNGLSLEEVNRNETYLMLSGEHLGRIQKNSYLAFKSAGLFVDTAKVLLTNDVIFQPIGDYGFAINYKDNEKYYYLYLRLKKGKEVTIKFDTIMVKLEGFHYFIEK